MSNRGTSELVVNQKNKVIYREFIPRQNETSPNLYVQVTYLVDPKTQRVNPATKEQDIEVLVSPFGEHGMSAAFNAPKKGVGKEVNGFDIEVSFYYTFEYASVKASLSIEKIFSMEGDVKPGHGLILVKTTINTKTRHGSTNTYGGG